MTQSAVPSAQGRTGRTLQLLPDVRRGDEDALAEVLRLNDPLVRSLTARFTGRGLETDDLYQLGRIGLIKAARGFDPSLGYAFSTFAVPHIMGEMRRALRDDNPVHVPRAIKEQAARLMRARETLEAERGRDPTVEELAAACGMSREDTALALGALSPPGSLHEPVADDGSLTLEDALRDDRAEIPGSDAGDVRDAIRRLPDRERLLIALRFFRGMTQCQTAVSLGVSQVQVSRLEKRALQKLREELA